MICARSPPRVVMRGGVYICCGSVLLPISLSFCSCLLCWLRAGWGGAGAEIWLSLRRLQFSGIFHRFHDSSLLLPANGSQTQAPGRKGWRVATEKICSSQSALGSFHLSFIFKMTFKSGQTQVRCSCTGEANDHGDSSRQCSGPYKVTIITGIWVKCGSTNCKC